MRGSFVLDSPTHGYITFTKAYPTWSAQYAGEFDATQRPLEVRGSWYTAAGDGSGDGGPFTMTFAPSLSIIDITLAPAATAAVAGEVSAAVRSPSQPPALQVTGDTAEADAEVQQAPQQPPPSYEAPHAPSRVVVQQAVQAAV